MKAIQYIWLQYDEAGQPFIFGFVKDVPAGTVFDIETKNYYIQDFELTIKQAFIPVP